MAMHDQSRKRFRRFAACLCLFAAVLLYVPPVVALSSPACCTNGVCPVHKHHASSNDAMPMDCGHAQMDACSMSCCHTTENTALNPQAFVIPGVATLSAPSLALESVAPADSSAFLFFPDPLSPPPRTFPAVL